MDDKVLNRFAVSPFLGENRILDQILLLEPFFGQLAWAGMTKKEISNTNKGDVTQDYSQRRS